MENRKRAERGTYPLKNDPGDPGNKKVTYAYDALNRLTTVTEQNYTNILQICY